jgi:hypothetical protein
MLAVILLMTLSPIIVWAQCPGTKLYFGGPVTDAGATRGKEANPAVDLEEAFDICQECPNGAYFYQYNTSKEKYVYRGRCVPEEEEPTGALLAQPVVTILLGLLAAGLLIWGIYLRLQLNRLKTGS